MLAFIRSWKGSAFLLGLVLLALAAWRPLAVPDEGRYADIARRMWQSGDWLVPRLDGIPFFHKPPLLHWLQSMAFELGGIHPWVSRWVPIGHALLMMCAMAWVCQRIWGQGLAFRCVWIMGTSLAFLISGQYINHDMLVAAWISVAIWCGALAILAEPAAQAWARWGFEIGRAHV